LDELLARSGEISTPRGDLIWAIAQPITPAVVTELWLAMFNTHYRRGLSVFTSSSNGVKMRRSRLSTTS
jgi:hypothetical protein